MKKVRLFLIIQSVLCILTAAVLIAGVIGIYRDGAALRAADPLAPIFTREIVAGFLRSAAPLLFVTVATAVAGLFLGAEDENGRKPVKGGRVENIAPGEKTGTVQKVLVAAAIVLIAAGVFNGSAMDVLGKAIKICTECVGLG